MYNLGLIDFTKNTFGPNLFFTNTFDEKFLEEKKSALSSIDLDDSIPIKIDNSIILTNEKRNSKNVNNKLTLSSEMNFDKRKSKKSSIGSYGSNIVIITNQEQSDDSKECPITAQVNKLLKDPQALRFKKYNSKRKRHMKK